MDGTSITANGDVLLKVTIMNGKHGASMFSSIFDHAKVKYDATEKTVLLTFSLQFCPQI